MNEPVDEVVGYPDEADLSLVFDMAAGMQTNSNLLH